MKTDLDSLVNFELETHNFIGGCLKDRGCLKGSKKERNDENWVTQF